jgi:hypothetical protein
LSAECERHEAKAADGDKGFDRDDFMAYVTATNALKRVLEVIGVKRRSRDVTPTLPEYLAARAALVEAEAVEARAATVIEPETHTGASLAPSTPAEAQPP